MSDDVVCFKLVNGFELVGKHSSAATHNSFVSDGSDAIFLDDAMIIRINQTENGQALGLSPISAIGAFQDENKPHLPFALYKAAILGQLPLDPEINRMYREATSRIALVR